MTSTQRGSNDGTTWTAEARQNVPSVARMYDYYLGGHHNFAADRMAAQAAISIYPELPLVMQANRAFLRRAVKFIAAHGVTHFLDIGSGIPTAGNVHEIAQRVNDQAEIVYVDIDPVAVAHGQAIVHDNRRVAILEGDLTQPERLLTQPAVRRFIDSGEPMAVLLVSMLHFLTDDVGATRAVEKLRSAMPSGSYLAITHATDENIPTDAREQMMRLYSKTSSNIKARSREQIASYFDGLALAEPGLVYMPEWQPEGPDELFSEHPERSISLAGVGRKP
jgi:hypothetical protein